MTTLLGQQQQQQLAVRSRERGSQRRVFDAQKSNGILWSSYGRTNHSQYSHGTVKEFELLRHNREREITSSFTTETVNAGDGGKNMQM